MGGRYDALIVGAGHNGLVAAAYLAGAGLRTLVLERRPLVGGACVTEELIPGHRFSTASYVCSLLRPEIIADLALHEHGFEMLPCRTSFTVFPDGRALLLGLGADEDAREIARYSNNDARAYPRFNAALARLADLIRPTLAMTPPDPAAPGMGDLVRLLRLGNRFRRLPRPDQTLLTKMMTMSCAALLDEWFESSALKASLAPTSTIGTYGSPRTPGTAFILLHYYLGEANGTPGSWGFVRGGMGGLAEALAAAARSRGAEIRVDGAVEHILVKGASARGVVLESGEEIEGRVIVSNADPKRTFLRLVDRADLPPEFVRGIETFRCAGNSAKINLAVSELPDFTALPGDGPHLRGSIQICGADESYLEAAFDDFKAGRPSRRPFLEVTIPSTVDGTLAPAGHHVMSMSMKFVPYRPATGDWESRREELGDLAIDTLAACAPNLRRSILFRQILTPRDLEERFGLTGGNIGHGDMALDQLFAMRPLLGWARYRTPIDGLYLCGAGTHPGGGVMGACGRNAAREILVDLRRGRVGKA